MSEVTQDTPEPTEAPVAAVSKTAWKANAVHKGVTLPSGSVVDIKLPDLSKMIKGGVIPNELIASALATAKAEEITEEVLKANWEYALFIVPGMLVSPKITEEDVNDLPVQDVELLTQFAGRQTDLDAVGHQLGGLETQKSFREARGILTASEALGSLG